MSLKDVCADPVFWIIITAISEIIGLSKLKDNSIIQVVIRLLLTAKPKEK